MAKSVLLIPVFFILVLYGCITKNDPYIISAPAGNRYTVIDKEGITVIPNGRLLTPAGRNLIVAPHPFGLVLSNNGKFAVTANSGTNPLSISIIHNLTSDPEIIQVPPGNKTDNGVLESVFMGLAVSPDNKKIYVAGGQNNSIEVFDPEGAKIDSIDCSVTEEGVINSDGYIGDMVITRDGNFLLAVDQMNFRLLIADTRK